jgi:hypothetical protein
MAKVWVQVWSAQVPGSVQVEESDLVKVQGLESAKGLVPMLVQETAEVEELRSQLVWEKVKVQQLESVLAQNSKKVKFQETENFQLSEKARESALKKGWGWVLGQENPPKQ